MTDIEAEREMSRSDVAEYLRTFADELDAKRANAMDGTGANDRPSHSEQRPDAESNADRPPAGASEPEDGADDTVETATDDADDTDAYDETDVERRNREGSNRSESDRRESDRNEPGESGGSGGSGGRVTFMVGNESTTINPPETVTFEVSVDSDSSLIGTGTGRTARFALHWDESAVPEDEDLSIR